MSFLTTLSMSILCVGAVAGCSSTVVRASGGAGGTASTSATNATSVTNATGQTVTGATASGVTGTSNVTSTSSGACKCGPGFQCCQGNCVNEANDPHNCGGCGTTCMAPASLCDGTCKVPQCSALNCSSSETCCGSQCCGAGTICCTIDMGVTVTECAMPVNGTCPLGCPSCQG